MSWNYRIVKEQYNGSEYYFLKEVYYDENGVVEHIAENPLRLDGLTPKNIKEDMYLAAFAFDKDVIDYDEISKDWENK